MRVRVRGEGGRRPSLRAVHMQSNAHAHAFEQYVLQAHGFSPSEPLPNPDRDPDPDPDPPPTPGPGPRYVLRDHGLGPVDPHRVICRCICICMHTCPGMCCEITASARWTPTESPTVWRRSQTAQGCASLSSARTRDTATSGSQSSSSEHYPLRSPPVTTRHSPLVRSRDGRTPRNQQSYLGELKFTGAAVTRHNSDGFDSFIRIILYRVRHKVHSRVMYLYEDTVWCLQSGP